MSHGPSKGSHNSWLLGGEQPNQGKANIVWSHKLEVWEILFAHLLEPVEKYVQVSMD